MSAIAPLGDSAVAFLQAVGGPTPQVARHLAKGYRAWAEEHNRPQVLAEAEKLEEWADLIERAPVA